MEDENAIVSVEDLVSASPEDLDYVRYRCQTDLFFLANNVLRSKNKKAKPLLRHVHGNIIDKLVHKFPTSNMGYAGKVPGEIRDLEDWSPIKERVILSSRGTLKSVIEAADIVQIILCDPNTRILIMSGRLGLAQSILRMARGYFETNDVICYLFPAWCNEIQVNAKEFTSPARHGVDYRDPTVQCATFGSVKAGVRADYIKLDDCTNEVNQATPELVLKSIESYDDLDPLVEPGGFIDFTGTTWAVDDLPEYIKRKGAEMEEETGEKQVIDLFQPIWKVKRVADEHPEWSLAQIVKEQNARDEREKKHRLEPSDVDLLWPEKLTARYLWPKYRKNPAKFAKQYLLCPESVTSGAFTHSLLLKQTKQLEDCPMPHQSKIFINWDLSGVSGKGDYAVGIVGIWEVTGRLFIIDAVVEKFTSSTAICIAIVRLFKKYNPDFHRIESANGSQLLSGELRRIAQEADLSRAFFPGWDAPSNEKDAKSMRIHMLAGAMERNQLQFFAGMDCIHEFYKQFEAFTGKTSNKKKDDVPDCVAQMYEKWKDSIGPKAIGYLAPSGNVVEFQSDGPNVNDANFGKRGEEDPHADEKIYADMDFLGSFTAPHT